MMDHTELLVLLLEKIAYLNFKNDINEYKC